MFSREVLRGTRFESHFAKGAFFHRSLKGTEVFLGRLAVLSHLPEQDTLVLLFAGIFTLI